MRINTEYETPELRVIRIKMDDVIAASMGDDGIKLEGTGEGDEWDLGGADW